MRRWTWMVLGGAVLGIALAFATHRMFPVRTEAAKKSSTHADADPVLREVEGRSKKIKKAFDEGPSQPSPETTKEMHDLAALGPRGQQATLAFMDAWLRRMYEGKLADTTEFRELVRDVLALDPSAPQREAAALKLVKHSGEKAYHGYLLLAFGRPGMAAVAEAWEEDARNAGGDLRSAALSPFPHALASFGADALPAMRGSLKHADPAVRRQALRTFALTVPEFVTELLPVIAESLKDKDPSVRTFAALALGELARPDHAPEKALAAALEDEDALVRLAAARTLGRHATADRQRVASVITALLAGDPFTDPLNAPAEKRKMWWDVAGTLSQTGAWTVWKGGTNYNTLFWDETAAHVLLDLGPNYRLPPEKIVELLRSCPHDGRHLVTLLAAQGDRAKTALPELVQMLKNNEDGRQRRRALIAIGKLGASVAADAMPDVLAALDHKDGPTRWQAFLALMQIDPAAARAKMPATLHPAIDAASGTVKRIDLTRVAQWTRCLWAEGSAAVLVPTTAGNSTPDQGGLYRTPTDWDVVGEIYRIENMIAALERAESTSKDVGPLGKDAIPLLLAFWQGTSRHPLTRASHGNKALALLAREGAAAEPAVPHMIEALRYYESNESGPGEMSKALAKIGDRALPYMIKTLEDPDKSDLHVKVLEAFQEFGAKAEPATPAVVKAIQSPKEEVRAKAVDAIGSMGSAAKGGVPDLRKLLQHANTDIRRHAADALGRIGPDAKVALPDLIALFPGDPSEQVRVVSVRSVSRMGKDAVEPLIKALEDQRPKVRLSAVEALLRLQDDATPALPALRKLADGDSSAEVRTEAAQVVRRLEAKEQQPKR